MKEIIVIPTGGLCNRIRTIVGAVSLAKILNSSITVIWTQDITLNAKFHDIFEPLPFPVKEVKLHSLWYRGYKFLLQNLRKYMLIDDDWILCHARNKTIETYKDELQGKNIIINSCQDIIRTGDYSIFHINEKLKEKMLPELAEGNIIGLHIRRTDSVLSIQHSPTSLFIEKIHEELVLNPNRKFYLATDDPKEEEIIKKEFSTSIITYHKSSLDRNNPKAIQDAAIDLYSLANCCKIYASYYSSFSDIAAQLGGIKKIVIKK